MARWTKENWARLDIVERSMLMEVMKGLHKGSYYGGWNMPEDVSSCSGCGEPTVYCGCYEIMDELCKKMGVATPDI